MMTEQELVFIYLQITLVTEHTPVCAFIFWCFDVEGLGKPWCSGQDVGLAFNGCPCTGC